MSQANVYHTDTGKPIGNKTACTLIISRAKAQQPDAQQHTPEGLGLQVGAALDTFITDVKPTDKRVQTLTRMLKERGYKW